MITRSKCGQATAAANPRSSTATLLNILDDCSGHISYRVALNPSSSFEILLKLVKADLSKVEGYNLTTTKCSILQVFTRDDLNQSQIDELRNAITASPLF